MNNYDFMDNLFVEYIRKIDDNKLFEKRKLLVEDVKNGIVYPKKLNISQGGVTDEAGNFIKISKLDALNEEDSFGGAYNKGEIDKRYENTSVIYIGNYWKQWGHFLIDSISRLWYLLENEISNYKICYTGQKLDGIYLDFFDLIGVDKSKLIYIDNPSQFKNVIVPECSHMPGLYYTKEWVDIFDKAIENAMKIYNKTGKKYGTKIIFSRKKFIKHFRAPFEIGEKNIIKLFEKNGFEVVYPEEHSIAEQIGIIQSSNEIVSISGTLAHTLIFAKQNTKLIQLKKYVEVNYRQVEINQCRNLKVYNIDCHISPFLVRNGGPFVFDVNNNLISFFEKNNYQIEKTDKIKYFFIRKGYLFYYIFVYVLFVKVIQRKFVIPTLSFSKCMDKKDIKDLERKMKKFYIKKFFK